MISSKTDGLSSFLGNLTLTAGIVYKKYLENKFKILKRKENESSIFSILYSHCDFFGCFEIVCQWGI